MNESIDVNDGAAQSEITVGTTIRSTAHETVPTSSASEPCAAITGSNDTLTAPVDQEDGDYIEDLKDQPLSLIKAKLREKQDLEGKVLLQIWEDKWKDRLHQRPRSRPKTSHEPHPRTPLALLRRLRQAVPEGSTDKVEEDIRPWALTPMNLNFLKACPLLRITDEASQSQIVSCEQGFLSGASDTRLTNRESRRLALKYHADWGNRKKTPFISTTTSIKDIARLASIMKRNRKKAHLPFTGTLSLANPFARSASGLTMLKMKDEISYYGLHHLLTKNGLLYYENEILMLFRIPPELIIRAYRWEDIENTVESRGITIEQWYETDAMADFRAHEADRKAGKNSQPIGIWSPGESIGGRRTFRRVISEEGRKRKAEMNDDGNSNSDQKHRRLEVSNKETILA